MKSQFIFFCHRKLLALRLFTAILLLSSVGQSIAQVSADEELRRRSQREAEERKAQQETKDVFLQPLPIVKQKYDVPEERPCFVVRNIQLSGDHMREFSWISSELEPYLGKCIGKSGINLVLKHINNELIARGFITTRVSIPEQDISTGILKLQLTAGVIHEFRFADREQRGTWFTAFPARPNDILNLRELEQGLEQMMRLPYQEVDMQISPGEMPGDSDIVITRKKTKPWRAVVSLDDSGGEATGKYQSSVTLAVDDLLGINDLFNISLNTDAKQESNIRGTRGNSAYYSFPYGYWTFTLATSNYHYHQTIAGAVQNFVSSGNSENIEGRMQRLIDRGQRHKTSAQFRVNKRRINSFIDDTEVLVQRRVTTAAELSLQHRQHMGQIVIDMNFAHRKGVPWLNAQPDFALPDAPTTRYRIWALDTILTTPLKINNLKLRYRGNIRAQFTNDLLFTQEFFAIGNRYTVRGFDGEQTLAAERGWLMRNEVGIPLWNSSHEVYVALDHGKISGPSTATLIGTNLTGSAIGVRGGIKQFNYDLSAGWSLNKPWGFRTQQPAYTVQLTYQF